MESDWKSGLIQPIFDIVRLWAETCRRMYRRPDTEISLGSLCKMWSAIDRHNKRCVYHKSFTNLVYLCSKSRTGYKHIHTHSDMWQVGHSLGDLQDQRNAEPLWDASYAWSSDLLRDDAAVSLIDQRPVVNTDRKVTELCVDGSLAVVSFEDFYHQVI